MVFVGKGPVLGVTVYLYSLISVFTDNACPNAVSPFFLVIKCC